MRVFSHSKLVFTLRSHVTVAAGVFSLDGVTLLRNDWIYIDFFFRRVILSTFCHWGCFITILGRAVANPILNLLRWQLMHLSYWWIGFWQWRKQSYWSDVLTFMILFRNKWLPNTLTISTFLLFSIRTHAKIHQHFRQPFASQMQLTFPRLTMIWPKRSDKTQIPTWMFWCFLSCHRPSPYKLIVCD